MSLVREPYRASEVAAVPQSTAPVSARWRNAVLIALFFISLTLIIRSGARVGMDRYLSPRYWSYAIPSYFSEVTYGGPRYTYYRELALHFVTTPPFSDVAKFEALLLTAAEGRVSITGRPHLFPADEKGTVDFVRMAFVIFGIHVQSLFYFYCALLASSLTVYTVAFRRDVPALFVGLVAIIALLVTVRTFSLTKELYSVTNPRAIGSLSVIPLIHLSLASLRRSRLTMGALAQLTFQAMVLVFVVSMRTSDAWQVVAAVGVAVLGAAAPGRSSQRVAAAWPAAVALALVAAYLTYQSYAFPQEYFARNLRTKIVWHNVLIGFALHPGIADWYGLRVDDPSVLSLIKNRVARDPSVTTAQIFWAPDETPDGMVKDFREYDRLCRATVWEIVRAHPLQTLKLFLWHKPRALFRSFEYAVGLDSHPLSYYLLDDQAVSLFTPATRSAMGAYFRPWSPIALFLLVAACVTAGITEIRRAFDWRTLTALAVIFSASLLPAVVTYPLVHVIAGTYWAGALLFYALAIRSVDHLLLLARRRRS